jgi:hypothetical protein
MPPIPRIYAYQTNDFRQFTPEIRMAKSGAITDEAATSNELEQTVKLVVLGANGRTGTRVLQAALDRDMDVTAWCDQRASSPAHAMTG